MKNNTIAYLNTKIWYRFLKIIYIFVFISALIYALNETIEEYSPVEVIDSDKSLIICDSGDIYTFNELWSNNISVKENVAEIKRLCSDIINETSKTKWGPQNNESIGVENFLEEKGYYDTPEQINYKIRTIHKTIDGWHLVFGYSIFWVLIICAVSEIIKRAFYYIVLGKINPSKK